MRIRVGSAVPAFLAVVFAAGCNLPQRRPDARLFVSRCAADAGSEFPAGQQLVGSVVPHRECLRLDARDSSTFTGGATRYVWTVDFEYPSGLTLPSSLPTTTVTLASTNGAFSEGRFFSHVAVDRATAHLHLTVVDSAGRSREDDTDLTLSDAPPSLGARSILQPRGFGLYVDPFMVVEPQISDADVAPAADGYVTRRAADLADEARIDVQQVVAADKPPLQANRCSDLPTRFGLPDPSDGNPLAWCFSIDPIDDPTTPEVEHYCASASDGSGCLDSVVRGHPDDEAFTLHLETNVVEPFGAVHPMPADCTTSDDRSGCVQVTLQDEVWTASGPGNFAQGAMVGRISPDWQRSFAETGLNPRDGVGVAGDVKGRRRWFAANNPIECGFLFLPPSQCGALLGVDAALDRVAVGGFGPIAGLDADRGDGVWVTAVSVSSSLNPTFSSSDPVTIPSGDYYVTYLSSAMLLAASSGQPLSSTPQSAIGIVHGLRHGGAAGSNEFAIQVLRVGGEVLLATAENCDHLQPATASAMVSCSSNAALGPGVGPYRLRELSLPSGAPFGGIDLDASGPAGVTLGLAGGGGPFHFLAPAGGGRVWIVRTTPSNPYGTTWQAELHDLPYVDAQVDAVVPMATGFYPLGMTYDPSSDELWIADANSGHVYWFSMASQSTVGAPAQANPVLTPFTFPLQLAMDGNGGVWVDDHLDSLHRRAAYVDPTTREATYLDTFVSAGVGIEPASRLGGDLHNAVWRADANDIVRSPADNPSEIPTLAYPAVFSSIGGVDPIDGAAYVYSIAAGQNLFRVDVDGSVTAFASGGRVEAGALLPTMLASVNQSAGDSAMLLLAVYSTSAGTSFVGALNVDRMRVAPASTVAIQDCPLADPLGTEIAAPCWMRLDGATARVPLLAGSTPVSAEQMRLSLDYSPDTLVRLRAYLLASDGTGGSYLLSMAPIAYPPTAAGPSAIEASVQLTGGALPANVPQPISSFTVSTPTAILGGVWLVQQDGTAQRWYLSDSGIVPDANIVIPPYPSGYVTEAVTTNPFNLGFATFRSLSGGPTMLAWGYLDGTGPSPTIVALGETSIAGSGEALVSSDFADVAWSTGEDGTLERWRLVVDTAYGFTMMRPEYIRPLDTTGALGPTPAGWSIKAGTF